MKPNVGTIDRIIRILLGVAVIALYFLGKISGITAVVLLIVAAVFIVTGLQRFCPLYTLFGINTKSKTETEQ